MIDVASIERFTTAGRDCAMGDDTMDPDTVIELGRIFDLIDHAIEDGASSRGES